MNLHTYRYMGGSRWSVGYYVLTGISYNQAGVTHNEWVTIRSFPTELAAAHYVCMLNGGPPSDLLLD